MSSSSFLSGGSAYERTDPDYNDKRTAHNIETLKSLRDPRWRDEFIKGLSPEEKAELKRRGIRLSPRPVGSKQARAALRYLSKF